MYIERLELINYRNYESIQLDFSPKINVFIGENAQGKTNVMESIYVLSMAKSHRTSNDKELIRWEADYGKIKGNIQRKYGHLPLELIFSKKGKKAKVNHLEQTKLSNYIGQLNVVMFAPEDLYLVKGSPKLEGDFLIWKLAKFPLSIYMIYLHFQKVLKQRNSILKQHQGKSFLKDVMFDVYTEQYIQCCCKINS